MSEGRELPPEEVAAREATQRERALWDEVIFRSAKRCSIDTKGIGPGEVLTKMANRIVSLVKENADLVELNSELVSQLEDQMRKERR